MNTNQVRRALGELSGALRKLSEETYNAGDSILVLSRKANEVAYNLTDLAREDGPEVDVYVQLIPNGRYFVHLGCDATGPVIAFSETIEDALDRLIDRLPWIVETEVCFHGETPGACSEYWEGTDE